MTKRYTCCCLNCNKEISVSNLSIHYKSEACISPKIKKIIIDTIDNICPLCKKQCKSIHSYKQHFVRCKSNPEKYILENKGRPLGIPAWNKGLKKITDIRVVKNALAISASTKGRIGRPHTNESKRKISLARSINNKGGRCKWFEVAGQKVQGTWEQNAALKFEELGIKWIKLKTNQHTFDYEMDRKIRCYTPDFYLPDYNIYLELKGRWWGKDREKMDIVLEKYKDTKIVVIEKDNYEKLLRGELVW